MKHDDSITRKNNLPKLSLSNQVFKMEGGKKDKRMASEV